MNREKNPEVLVVGAGPTGLALASALAQSGVKVRIVDKSPAPSDRSKALGVQAGTLESLERFFGEPLVKKMIEAGFAAREGNLYFGKKDGIRLDLSLIPSRYNFILVLEQNETERILEALLGSFSVSVERESELVSFQERDGKIWSQIRQASGKTEEVVSDFIVGCDGAHSKVRQELKIPFVGGAYTGNFILADVHLTWPWEYGGVRTFIQREGVMACFPMRGHQRYRLIILKANPVDAQTEVTMEELRGNISEISPQPMEIADVTWLTRFRVSHRITDHFRVGRGFLAGDAAHIHSPVGGQGMNTGIQEALNLGYRFTQVLRKGADPSVLDAYESERRPIARRVLRGTDLVSRFGALPRSGWMLRLRDSVCRSLLKSTSVQRRLVTVISQVNVAHADLDKMPGLPLQ